MAELNKINILIVEDEALIAEDIKEICESADYCVPMVCYNASQALAAIDKNQFDMAIFDINLEDELTGIDLANYIHKRNIKLPFIFLTSYSDAKTLNETKKTYPMGYIVKPFTKNQVISTIEISLYNYHLIRNPSYLTIDELENKYKVQFSQREQEVIHLLCEGQTNQQIAKNIYVSINTVKFHIKSIYDKLQISSRSNLLLCMLKSK